MSRSIKRLKRYKKKKKGLDDSISLTADMNVTYRQNGISIVVKALN